MFGKKADPAKAPPMPPMKGATGKGYLDKYKKKKTAQGAC